MKHEAADTDRVMRTNGRTLREDRDGTYFIRLRLVNEERTRLALEAKKQRIPAWAA